MDAAAASRLTEPFGLTVWRPAPSKAALLLAAFSAGEVWFAILLKRRNPLKPKPLFFWHRVQADVVTEQAHGELRLVATLEDTPLLSLRARPPRRTAKWTQVGPACAADADGRLRRMSLELSGAAKKVRRGVLLELGDHPMAREAKAMRLSLTPLTARYVENASLVVSSGA